MAFDLKKASISGWASMSPALYTACCIKPTPSHPRDPKLIIDDQGQVIMIFLGTLKDLAWPNIVKEAIKALAHACSHGELRLGTIAAATLPSPVAFPLAGANVAAKGTKAKPDIHSKDAKEAFAKKCKVLGEAAACKKACLAGHAEASGLGSGVGGVGTDGMETEE
ncbi:hypothetical protein C8R44DRAFT_753526 [Mycena epipterygia]|nr:hypothetical protein C8R44DRAFT_753526 [Mycena epipterygia]